MRCASAWAAAAKRLKPWNTRRTSALPEVQRMNGERGNPSMFTSKAFISKTLTPARIRAAIFSPDGNLAAGALGVALAGASTSRAQSSSSKLMAPRRIIDVLTTSCAVLHSRAPARSTEVGPGITQIFEWTPEQAIERMDASGVAASILSISTPGPWFGQRRRAVGSRARLTIMRRNARDVSGPFRPVLPRFLCPTPKAA